MNHSSWFNGTVASKVAFSSQILAVSEAEKVASPHAIVRDVFSAAVGSVACCYTGQPFDTVKVRMQTNPKHFPDVFRTTARIMKQEGLTAFWKGSVPTAIGMVFENAVAFGVNEALNRAFPNSLHDTTRPPDLFKPFWTGALTGCCASVVLLPSEVIKAKLQVATGVNTSFMQIWRQMIKSQGLKSPFVGFDAQLARDSIFYAVFFGGYKFSCYCLSSCFPSLPEEMNYFVSGGLAGEH
jgi:solute carrier family 25 (mitochondrial carnitine/acylcarnitine transporter), member 20/29